ncbi:hypothetical protein FKM82_017566 [Ascaphus truei]
MNNPYPSPASHTRSPSHAQPPPGLCHSPSRYHMPKPPPITGPSGGETPQSREITPQTRRQDAEEPIPPAPGSARARGEKDGTGLKRPGKRSLRHT